MPTSEGSMEGPIVVDANVLFAALLRDGATRHILLFGRLDLHTPEHFFDEFARNRPYLLAKSRATEAAFDLLVDSLRDRVADVPLAVIRPHLARALEETGRKDALDAPYVAAGLAIGGALWTHDRRLAAKISVPILTTADLVADKKRG